MPENMSIFNGFTSNVDFCCKMGRCNEKTHPGKGVGFLSFDRVVEGLFFLLFQRFAEDVAEAGTGIG